MTEFKAHALQKAAAHNMYICKALFHCSYVYLHSLLVENRVNVHPVHTFIHMYVHSGMYLIMNKLIFEDNIKQVLYMCNYTSI